MKLRILGQVLMIAFGLLFLTMLSLWQVQQVSRAQGSGPIALTKVLNRPSNVVRVGEVLTFTIALTNTSLFTLDGVTLVDTYDFTTLAFAGATPPESTVNPATGVISWSNVAAPPIGPGQSVVVTVVFTAEHPKTAVVNAVRAQDLISGGLSLTETAETSQTNEAIGGSAPVVKFLEPGATPEAGLPVTFTHIITNDGAALMTYLPLTDTYDPTYLDFLFAIPVTPTITSPPGILVWDDLTSYFGPIQPFATVVITTVFSATTQVLNTSNEASTAGARDQYNNDLTAGFAQVPITIIADTPTPIPRDDSDNDNDNDNEDRPAPTATATMIAPTAVATVAASQSATPETSGPKYLPETGHFRTDSFLALVVGVILIVTGWYLKKTYLSQ